MNDQLKHYSDKLAYEIDSWDLNVGLDEQLMTVPLRVTVDGKTLEPGVAAPLFVTRIPGGAVQQGGLR